MTLTYARPQEMYKIPYITTVAAAVAAARGIRAHRNSSRTVRSLQSYHTDIKEL